MVCASLDSYLSKLLNIKNYWMAFNLHRERRDADGVQRVSSHFPSEKLDGSVQAKTHRS
jgi:hypothetical protein